MVFRFSKKYFFLTVTILAITLCGFNLSAKTVSNRFVNIGTGNITGIYYPAGAAICKLVNKLKTDNAIRCSVESTSGSVFNIEALKNKQLDLAITQSDFQYFAYNGMNIYKTPNKNLRSLFSLHSDAFTIVTRADANIKTFKDIKGKRINIGNQGSGNRSITELLFKIYGLSKEDFSLVTELDSLEQPEALCENKIDIMIYNVGHPNGAVQEAVSSCETRIISLDEDKITQLILEHPYYNQTIIPGGMYAGNPDDIKTFGAKATIVALDILDDDIAYNIVKTIFDNINDFRALHPVFNNLDIREMISKGNTAPIHQGAKKYFQEKNILY